MHTKIYSTGDSIKIENYTNILDENTLQSMYSVFHSSKLRFSYGLGKLKIFDENRFILDELYENIYDINNVKYVSLESVTENYKVQDLHTGLKDAGIFVVGVGSILPETGMSVEQLNNITLEPTGFRFTDSVSVTGNADRTITLQGNTEAYFKGVLKTELVNGYISPAHGTDTTVGYFFVFDGTNYRWLNLGIDHVEYNYLLICYTFWAGTEWIYVNETHGLMQHQVHAELHSTIGTYLRSGGTFTAFTLNSTTAANRRPDVSETSVVDEDCFTTNVALNTKIYAQLQLSGVGIASLVPNNAEIIHVVGNIPYYNQFTGGNWIQTPFTNNAYGKIFIFALPCALGTISQKYRYVFVQPQTVSTILATIQAVNVNSINMAQFSNLIPEIVFIGEIIVRYASNNWTITSLSLIRGTRVSQSILTGGFLSAVATDENFTGNGTPASPLSPVYKDGFFDYNDSATAITPINYTANTTIALPCNGLGTYTTKAFKPINVTDLFNSTTNKFTFDELSIGDEVIIRVSILANLVNNNSALQLSMQFDLQGQTYNLKIGAPHSYKNSGLQPITDTLHFYIGSETMRLNDSEIRFTSDSNCTIIVEGFYISVKRRF